MIDEIVLCDKYKQIINSNDDFAESYSVIKCYEPAEYFFDINHISPLKVVSFCKECFLDFQLDASINQHMISKKEFIIKRKIVLLI